MEAIQNILQEMSVIENSFPCITQTEKRSESELCQSIDLHGICPSDRILT